MKRLSIAVIIILSILVIIPSIAFAQGPAPTEPGAVPATIEIANLFAWARTTPPDWAGGALLAGLGLVGALVTMFGLIGGAVPGTAGQAKMDADANRLDRLYKRLEELTSAAKIDAGAVGALENSINNLRDDLRAERWRQFGIAAALYSLLGAFFAAALAQDMLQALVIGAGWTVYMGNFGLKQDHEERSSQKDAALDQLEAVVTSQQQVIDKILKKQEGGKKAGKIKPVLPELTIEAVRPLSEVAEVVNQAKIARAL